MLSEWRRLFFQHLHLRQTRGLNRAPRLLLLHQSWSHTFRAFRYTKIGLYATTDSLNLMLLPLVNSFTVGRHRDGLSWWPSNPSARTPGTGGKVSRSLKYPRRQTHIAKEVVYQGAIKGTSKDSLTNSSGAKMQLPPGQRRPCWLQQVINS